MDSDTVTRSGPSKLLLLIALAGAALFALGSISAVAGQGQDAFSYTSPTADGPIGPSAGTPTPGTGDPATDSPTGLPSAGSGGLAGGGGSVPTLAWAMIAMGAFLTTTIAVRYGQRRG